jgi:thiol-disulfide isomerase/thioredoxin
VFYDNYIVKVTDFFLQKKLPINAFILPQQELDKLKGGEFTLYEAKENVIVLDFWATTCGPCLSALPGYESIQQWAKANNKSVAIYCVAHFNLKRNASG